MSTFIIAALSADGFIAQDPKVPSTEWTSAVDKKFFSQKTKAAGVIIMGRKTYDTVPDKYRPLKDRLNVIYSATAPKNQADFLAQVKSYRASQQPNPIFTSLPPQDLITSLKAAGYHDIAIGGGQSIYSLFFDAGVVEELFLTIEPVKFGNGISLFKQPFDLSTLPLLETIDLSPDTKVWHYIH